MSVNATIPVTEDYREVTLAAGEADAINDFILQGEYLYGCTGTAPAKLLKINKENFVDRSVITFANDNEHIQAGDLIFAGTKIYVWFNNNSPNPPVIAEVDPATLVTTDFYQGTTTPGSGTIASDNVSLFNLRWFIGTGSSIIRRALSGGAVTTHSLGLAFPFGNRIRYSNGSLFLYGQMDFAASDLWVLKLNPSTFAVQASTTVANGAGAFSVIADMGVSSDHIWIGQRGTPTGIIRRFTKANLTLTEIATGILAQCESVTEEGIYIWATFDNGKAVRIHSGTLEQRVYELNAGYFRRLISGTPYLFSSFFDSPTKIERYRIPAEQVAAQRFGSTGYDDGRAVARGADGSIYLTGLFQRTVTFGSVSLTSYQNPQTSAYAIDIYIAKLDASGSVQWAVKASTTNPGSLQNPLTEKSSKSIAVDSAGDLWVTGYFQGTVDFGGTSKTSAGSNDIFVAKYSGEDGSLLYVERYGDTGDDKGVGIAVDGNDNVIVTGSFSTGADIDGVSFGGPKLKPAITDGFVAKYNSAGAWIDSIQASCNTTVTPGGVAVDGNDNIWVTGAFVGTCNFGGGQLNPTSEFSAIYLVKLDSSLTDIQRTRFGNSFAATAFAVACDSNDNVVITGQVKGGMDFGGGIVGGEPQSAAFHSYIVKYNSDRVYQWAIPVGFSSANPSTGNAIAALPNGDIVAGGSFSFTVNFQPNLTLPAVSKTSAGSTDIFIARYTSAGVYASVNQYGSTSADFCFGLAALTGGVIATGGFVGTVNFGTVATPNNLTSAGGVDAWLLPLTF